MNATTLNVLAEIPALNHQLEKLCDGISSYCIELSWWRWDPSHISFIAKGEEYDPPCLEVYLSVLQETFSHEIATPEDLDLTPLIDRIRKALPVPTEIF